MDSSVSRRVIPSGTAVGLGIARQASSADRHSASTAGRYMFNMQVPGPTLAITGPWRRTNEKCLELDVLNK
jgi:hypothetical protein